MPKQPSEKVPKEMQAKFEAVTQLTDAFCHEHLNQEYAQLSRQLTAALCRKRPSPLASGQAKTWACGIVHALGMVNFLDDPSQTPHMKASDLYKAFGVGASTGQGKSKLIRDVMKMSYYNADWCLPSRLDSNLMAWLVTIDGMIYDARTLPRPMQEEAVRKGLIPYLPPESL